MIKKSNKKFVSGIPSLDIKLNWDEPKPSKYSFKKFMNLPDLEHYLSIRGGTFFEKVLKGMVSLADDCTLIQKKFLGGSQIDLLFVNSSTETVYYFEVRCNIDNDTEKEPATAQKINLVKQHVATLPGYSHYKLVYGVLCPTNTNDDNVMYSDKYKTKAFSLENFLTFLDKGSSKEDLDEAVDSIRKLYLAQLNA